MTINTEWWISLLIIYKSETFEPISQTDSVSNKNNDVLKPSITYEILAIIRNVYTLLFPGSNVTNRRYIITENMTYSGEHLFSELTGWGGLDRHGFFSNSQYFPWKLTGHRHVLVSTHMPEFLQSGSHLATGNYFLDRRNFDNLIVVTLRRYLVIVDR